MTVTAQPRQTHRRTARKPVVDARLGPARAVLRRRAPVDSACPRRPSGGWCSTSTISSEFANQVERVVVGQRLMQASSGIFAGWLHANGDDYCCRQLKDWKGSAKMPVSRPTQPVSNGGNR